jgi:hypothetical protein
MGLDTKTDWPTDRRSYHDFEQSKTFAVIADPVSRQETDLQTVLYTERRDSIDYPNGRLRRSILGAEYSVLCLFRSYPDRWLTII